MKYTRRKHFWKQRERRERQRAQEGDEKECSPCTGLSASLPLSHRAMLSRNLSISRTTEIKMKQRENGGEGEWFDNLWLMCQSEKVMCQVHRKWIHTRKVVANLRYEREMQIMISGFQRYFTSTITIECPRQ